MAHTHETSRSTRIAAHIVDLALAEYDRGVDHTRRGFDLTGGKATTAASMLLDAAAEVDAANYGEDEQLRTIDAIVKRHDQARELEQREYRWHAAEPHAIVVSVLRVAAGAFRATIEEEESARI